MKRPKSYKRSNKEHISSRSFFGKSNKDNFFSITHSPQNIIRRDLDDCTDTSDTAYEKAKKGDSIEIIAKRLRAANRIYYKGSTKLYGAAMIAKYRGEGKEGIREGECIVYDKNWTDPNIGSLTKIAPTNELKTKIIATIYGEQTLNLPEQHKYIWHSMKQRIVDYSKPSEFLPAQGKGVLTKSEFHAFDKNDPNYANAKKYLTTYYSDGKKPADKDTHEFKPSVVDKIKQMVESDWNDTTATDSGIFYFHWTNRRAKSPKLFEHWKANKKSYMAKANKAGITEARKKELFIELTKECGLINYANLVTKKKFPKNLTLSKVILGKSFDLVNWNPPIRTMFIFK